MNENKKNLLRILFLTLIITGAFTFLYSIFFWDEPILYMSLIQLLGGSAGIYLLGNTPKTPL